MERRKQARKPPAQTNEEVSLIQEELGRFQKEVNSILTAMESINLMAIEDHEARLKSINTKVMIGIKLPQLLSALDDLKNKAKLKVESIKGSKDISLLESGQLKI